MKYLFPIVLLIVLTSCNAQEKKAQMNKVGDSTHEEISSQIAEYVTGAFEDSKGNLWFGTLSKGIAKYDGKELVYYTKKDGLPSDRVIGLIEDANHVFWFKTGEGLSSFDGHSFTNYSISEDFFTNVISNLFIDSKGTFWVGTWGGVYIFEDGKFTPFAVPYPEVSTPINQDTKNWITEITEDKDGNIWFARDGYGVSKYDGTSFTHILKKDGLHSNCVTEIEFDEQGNIWFGTRVAERDNPDPTKREGSGGINKLTKNEFVTFPEIKGFNRGEVYGIYTDPSKSIWISTVKNGVYKFDGKAFIHYPVPISIMSMLSDQNGTMWLAGAGGLYKINQNEEIVNVRKNGPWK